MYEIEISKNVLKFIKDKKNSDLIFDKLKRLKNFNLDFSLDVKKLKGKYKNIYRFRIGKIRFLFYLIDKKIIIYACDHRKNIYN